MDRRRGRVVCHLFVITSDTETARGQIRPGENGREYFFTNVPDPWPIRWCK